MYVIIQASHYNDYIRENDTMRLVEIYADEGITGTSVDKRDEFKRMMRDAKNRKLDRILVKSVTRFARNALECIEAVRELKTCGVSVAAICFCKRHLPKIVLQKR